MKKVVLLITIIILLTFSINAQVTINPCAKATAIHVVVIGSSTAAGTGPNSPDSAWVNRYRTYLQNINPQSQVTNLAIGGTTTYHIMPDWYVAPVNKPATNTNNNVTAAINLGADAIILNMPSNDAGNGFGINEQMSNFITISNSSDSVNVPIWICTTQPRSSLSAAGKLIQTGVRDSILSYFGSFAIDFWNGFADTSDNILIQFDSGDGVHMNGAAHGILNDRVINSEIPNALGDTLSYVDHVLTDLYITNNSICGDSNATLNAIVTNVGQNSALTVDVNIKILDNTSLVFSDFLIPVTGPLNACTSDTVSLLVNSYNGVSLDIQSYLINTDIDQSNDTSGVLTVKTKGYPSIFGINDTICFGDSTTLIAAGVSSSDTTVWYDSLFGGNIIAYGDSLHLNNISLSQTYFAESVRGNLYFDESLFTTSNTTTNYNGIMFDIVALDTIIIDSLMIKINSTGQQAVVAYNKTGGYSGFEMNAGAWSLWGIDTVQVDNVGDFKVVNYTDMILYPNDTLGVYLHMQNSNADLSYQASSGSLTFSNNHLSIASGSGITYTFGSTFNPRNWSGEVFYHHGFNPLGDCVSPRIPVSLMVSQPLLNLGVDTILDYSQFILLDGDNSFSSYLWSDGSSQNQLLVDSTNFNLGVNTIWLEVLDSLSCKTSDTILVTFDPILSINDLTSGKNVYLSPNPTNGKIKVKGIHSKEGSITVKLMNSNGVAIDQFNLRDDQLIDLNHLPKGIYFLSFVIDAQHPILKKIVLY